MSNPIRAFPPEELPPRPKDELLIARPYPVHIPDGEYLAVCTATFHLKESRRFGSKIFLTFKLFEGDYAGKVLQMYLRPSAYPTSRFYRAWAIAHGGPPQSRNTLMSPRKFEGKLFKIRTSTVRPRHQVIGPNGRSRAVDFLPESFWYSKVDYLISLEVTNELITANFVTRFSSNSLSESQLSEGWVGSRKLEAGNRGQSIGFGPATEAQRDGKISQPTNPAQEETSAPTSLTPAEEQKRKLNKYLTENGMESLR
jgi:hypothetical protein